MSLSKKSKGRSYTPKKFSELGLRPEILHALHERFGYETATEIQANTIPIALQGRDVFGKAGTGHGKTLAFLIPTVEICLRSPAAGSGFVNAVILSPTKELAQQTHAEVLRLSKFSSLRSVLVIGGSPVSRQLRELSQPTDIIVATPGRLKDILENKVVKGDDKDGDKGVAVKELVSRVKMIVLDEADRLLDQGFIRDINKILGFMPTRESRQAQMFTATVNDDVQEISKKLLREPIFVDVVRADDPPAKLRQEYVLVPPKQVGPSLLHVLKAKLAQRADQKIIVFLPGVQMTKFVASVMEPLLVGTTTIQLHSDMDQGKRSKAVTTIKAAKSAVVFATDVIARGLDIDDITLVVQVGWVDHDTYTHRAGRTARAGREGEALILLTPEECSALTSIVKTRHPKLPLVQAAQDSSLTGALPEGLPPLQYRGEDDDARRAFAGLLGSYKSHMRELGWKGQVLASFLKHLFAGFGISQVPDIKEKLLRKLGLALADFHSPSKAPSRRKCEPM